MRRKGHKRISGGGTARTNGGFKGSKVQKNISRQREQRDMVGRPQAAQNSWYIKCRLGRAAPWGEGLTLAAHTIPRILHSVGLGASAGLHPRGNRGQFRSSLGPLWGSKTRVKKTL